MRHGRVLGCLAVLLIQGAAAVPAFAAGDKIDKATGQPKAIETPPRENAGSDVSMSEPPKPAALPEPLPGQLSSKFAIDDRNPEDSVPTPKQRDKDPLEYGYLLQDMLVRAEDARRASDYPGVIKYYRAIAKAVPDTATAWSKLCEAYEIVQDRDRAIRACKYAIARKGVELQDYTRYVRLFLAKDGPLAPDEKKEVMAVFAHLDQQPSLEASTNLLRCEFGVKESDVAALETCTKTLSRIAPDDPKTIVFQWNLAMQKGQRAEAEQLVVRAKKAGVVLDSIERMEKITHGSGRFPKGLIGGVALFGIAGLALWAVRRRRLTLDRLAR